MYLPGSSFSTSVEKIPTDRKHSVLLFLHGCAGLNAHHVAWAKFIADLGFVVILPDSMARPARPANCTNGKPTWAFPEFAKYRQQEITYALKQVLDSEWADKNNIFLMGHSEGGIAAAQSPHREFAGVIISAWTCSNSHPNPKVILPGIFSPKDLPILVVAPIRDGWFVGTPVEGRCANHAADRKNFKQIDLDGWVHDTFEYPEAKVAVKNFLIEHRSTK